jgi:hypothetical protein
MTDAKISNLMTTLDVTRKGAERIADIVRAGAKLLFNDRVIRVFFSHVIAIAEIDAAVVEQNYEFKQRLLQRVNAIIRGD